MTLAFLTGALAAGIAAGALATLAVWVATVVTGSEELWGGWAVLVIGTAVLFAAATYVAERSAHRRTVTRQRAKGEPWAFRED